MNRPARVILVPVPGIFPPVLEWGYYSSIAELLPVRLYVGLCGRWATSWAIGFGFLGKGLFDEWIFSASQSSGEAEVRGRWDRCGNFNGGERDRFLSTDGVACGSRRPCLQIYARSAEKNPQKRKASNIATASSAVEDFVPAHPNGFLHLSFD